MFPQRAEKRAITPFQGSRRETIIQAVLTTVSLGQLSVISEKFKQEKKEEISQEISQLTSLLKFPDYSDKINDSLKKLLNNDPRLILLCPADKFKKFTEQIISTFTQHQIETQKLLIEYLIFINAKQILKRIALQIQKELKSIEIMLEHKINNCFSKLSMNVKESRKNCRKLAEEIERLRAILKLIKN